MKEVNVQAGGIQIAVQSQDERIAAMLATKIEEVTRPHERREVPRAIRAPEPDWVSLAPVGAAALMPKRGAFLHLHEDTDLAGLDAVVRAKLMPSPAPVRPRLYGFIPWELLGADEHGRGPLIEDIGPLRLMRMLGLVRKPGLEQLAAARLALLEAANASGREVKAEDIESQAMIDAMAATVPKEREVWVVLDTEHKRLFVGSDTDADVVAATRLLAGVIRGHVAGFPVEAEAANDRLRAWIIDQSVGESLSLGENCVLAEGTGRISYRKQVLDDDGLELQARNSALAVKSVQLIHDRGLVFDVAGAERIGGLRYARFSKTRDRADPGYRAECRQMVIGAIFSAYSAYLAALASPADRQGVSP